MATQTDSSGQPFREFPISKDEKVRVTYVEQSEWVGGPAIRIQKRDHRGKLVRGPELPADATIELLGAVSELVNEAKRKKP